MREILEQTGYRIIGASRRCTRVKGTAETLRRCTSSDHRYHHAEDGWPVVESKKALAIKPGLKFLFISGDHDKIVDSKEGSGQKKHYLSKPFAAGQFLNMERERANN